MKNSSIRNFKRKYLWKTVAYKKLILNRSSYLHSTGWVKSLMVGHPCRNNGLEIPWMNYSIVNFLEKRLQDDFSLFEFGSGYSTFFYSRLVKKVHSIEYDKEWYELIQSRLPENVKLTFEAQDIDGEYCRAVAGNDEKYDVVIVDGRDRVNCVLQSLEYLSERGVIILDDANRKRYRDVFYHIEDKGFRSIDFEGLKPGKFDMSVTSVIYKDNNCMGL